MANHHTRALPEIDDRQREKLERWLRDCVPILMQIHFHKWQKAITLFSWKDSAPSLFLVQACAFAFRRRSNSRV